MCQDYVIQLLSKHMYCVNDILGITYLYIYDCSNLSNKLYVSYCTKMISPTLHNSPAYIHCYVSRITNKYVKYHPIITNVLPAGGETTLHFRYNNTQHSGWYQSSRVI